MGPVGLTTDDAGPGDARSSRVVRYPADLVRARSPRRGGRLCPHRSRADGKLAEGSSVSEGSHCVSRRDARPVAGHRIREHRQAS